MHDVAILVVSAEDVGDDFAECLWKDSFIDVLDGVVNIFFGGTYAPHHIAIVHDRFRIFFSLFLFIPQLPTCKGL